MIEPGSASARRTRGFTRIAGVDEAGRGPLAGPVVAAAVILPHGFTDPGLADSKTLTAGRRAALSDDLLRRATVAVAFVPAPAIDALNIHRASLLAMHRAVMGLAQMPDLALFDGKFVPRGLPVPGEAIVGGDGSILAIAAASIVAKVARDRLMARAEQHFPGYGFSRHFGYPTARHKAALQVLGLSPLHRLSYAPCRAVTATPAY